MVKPTKVFYLIWNRGGLKFEPWEITHNNFFYLTHSLSLIITKLLLLYNFAGNGYLSIKYK